MAYKVRSLITISVSTIHYTVAKIIIIIIIAISGANYHFIKFKTMQRIHALLPASGAHYMQ